MAGVLNPINDKITLWISARQDNPKMAQWFNYLKNGLSRRVLPDQLTGEDEVASIKDVWRTLWPYIKMNWRSGLLSTGLIIISSLILFPGPLINRFLIDDVILARRIDLLPLAIFLFIGLKVLTSSTNMMQNYQVVNFQESVMLDIQKSLLKHLLRLPKSFFDKKEIGYLISRINSDLRGLSWFFSGVLAYVISAIIRFIGGVAFLFYLEWRLAIITVILLPLMLIIVKYFSKRIHTLSQQSMEQGATILAHLQETIASIPLVKAFNTEDRANKQMLQAYETNRQLTMERSVVGSFANLLIKALPELTRAVVFIAGAYLAIQGSWTLGSLLAFESYIAYVHEPALYFADLNFSLQYSLAALERVMALFNIVPEDNLEKGRTVTRLEGEVEFRNVSFAYGGYDQVLKGLSFLIQPGEHVAIVGPSGVGKTTLISLILSFYKPTQGEIFFDGVLVDEYNLQSLRKRIGYVSQSTLLLSGTFNENLRYGNQSASPAEVEEAARVAGIHDFIVNLPQGYESKITERGVNLSEGQKQRLSIARALVKKPDIFIFDEPTAALDSILERSIFDALPSYIKDKTLLIIAHGLDTIQNSDRILLLDDQGSLSVGTHKSLLAENAYYRQLWAQQQLSNMDKSK
jgi:ABC-type multidrug transport system fused ATPase/permease subunit